ncbi:hypothetical protein I7I53_12228 [Histoplasma capsulatum var. duboisii H88]|uniref:Uncharacterized protein n=1 Tax=Ajellomyces capsulatus (strain H88) TaxID=544711 RepID=A0A8A1LVF4_AJEC8|nr:hypothetical protein I7I53_12228 [Histoplasma capsulatum var. duboisii H88]
MDVCGLCRTSNNNNYQLALLNESVKNFKRDKKNKTKQNKKQKRCVNECKTLKTGASESCKWKINWE